MQPQDTLVFGTPEKNLVWVASMSLVWSQIKHGKGEIVVEAGKQVGKATINKYEEIDKMKIQKPHGVQIYKKVTGEQNGDEVARIEGDLRSMKFDQKVINTTTIAKDGLDQYCLVSLMKNLKYAATPDQEDMNIGENQLKGLKFKAGDVNSLSSQKIPNFKQKFSFFYEIKLEKENDQLLIIKQKKGQKSQIKEVFKWFEGISEGDWKKKKLVSSFWLPQVSIDFESCTDLSTLVMRPELRMGESRILFKLRIDQKGVCLENVTEMCEEQCNEDEEPNAAEPPFWIVLREKAKLPYLICYCNKPVEELLGKKNGIISK